MATHRKAGAGTARSPGSCKQFVRVDHGHCARVRQSVWNRQTDFWCMALGTADACRCGRRWVPDLLGLEPAWLGDVLGKGNGGGSACCRYEVISTIRLLGPTPE